MRCWSAGADGVCRFYCMHGSCALGTPAPSLSGGAVVLGRGCGLGRSI